MTSAINNIRALAMAGVVMIHAATMFVPDLYTTQTDAGDIQLALIQLSKWATPVFFVLSGLLIGGKTLDGHYIARRLRRVGLPWMFWASVYGGWYVVTQDLSYMSIQHAVAHRALDVLLCSIYWFVANMFVSLAILYLLRRWLDSMWLGASLFAVSAFYGLNLYYGWVWTTHTAAIGGYVSYYWLGVYVARNYQRVTDGIAEIPGQALTCVVGVAFLAAMSETYWLSAVHPNPLSTLRLSNQLFAVLALIGLVKLNLQMPRWINPRTETFGVYLIHPLVLIAVKAGMSALYVRVVGTELSADARVWSSPAFTLTVFLVSFTVVYGATLAIVKALIACRLGALVGAEKPRTITKQVSLPLAQQAAA